MKKVLILGVNGFIGHHLTQRIVRTTDWEVYGMDVSSSRLESLLDEPRFHFVEGDITINKEWVEYHVRKCDVILPLVAIATPAIYVREPLRVFELDFEANLPIVRSAVRYRKHLVFPSTSEVYGMCEDREFDAEQSSLVYGPINKPRWIYACAKQLMDRVIAGYGLEQGLRYTLFRPFNWIGPGLDSLFDSREGSSRVVTQFLGQLIRGEPMHLVDGGHQRRTFCDISDGVSALMKIIANDGDVANGRIYNVGNPVNDLSVRELAELMLRVAAEFPEYACRLSRSTIDQTSAEAFYGSGYQDVQQRVPKIDRTMADLDWRPYVPVEQSLREIFAYYRDRVGDAQQLLPGAPPLPAPCPGPKPGPGSRPTLPGSLDSRRSSPLSAWIPGHGPDCPEGRRRHPARHP